MPFGDGTGPDGMGPMTGRAAGYCAGYTVPGHMNLIPRRGFGFGFGRGGGRGGRHGFHAGWQRAAYGVQFWGPGYGYAPVPFSATPEQEMDALKKQSEYLEKTLADLNQRIQDLESEQQKKS